MRHVYSEKIQVPDGIWTHDPPWRSQMLYHWATVDSVASKGNIVGIDLNRIAPLHSHVLAPILIFFLVHCFCKHCTYDNGIYKLKSVVFDILKKTVVQYLLK